MAGGKTKSSEKVCNKCSVSVKNYVLCSNCGSYYHPACLLRIPGAHVEMDGGICCCTQLPQKVQCQCNEKDKEIIELKQRIFDLNSRHLEQTLNELNLSESEMSESCEVRKITNHCVEEDSNQVLVEIGNIGSKISLMESTLTAKLTGMESLLEGSSSFDRSTNHENSKNVNKSIAAPSGECLCDESLVEQESAILSSQVNINIARKRRVLIVGDGNCREARKILLDYTKSNFDVISFFKPNAPLEETLNNIQQMSRGFDKHDLIIVLAGINNVLQGKPLKEAFLDDLVSHVQHTRLCVGKEF